MNPSNLLILAIILPLAAVPLIAILGERFRNLREAVTLFTSVGLFVLIAHIADLYTSTDGELFRFHSSLFSIASARIAPHLQLSLSLEPLGLLFALVASFLWAVNAFYSIGYMRRGGEKNQTRFYCLFPVAISASLGIAFSHSLLTLFIFYEMLTLSTYPLVAHKQNAAARSGARVYLALLLFTSLVLFLPAILIVAGTAGTLEFTQGGIIAGAIDDRSLPWLIGLFAFGIGKAALMPLHHWLPAAMVAPTPVSALLHAVAVVKAGAFAMLKIFLYIFGLETLADSGASNWLVFWASLAILLASISALRQKEFKARLAYSTIGQLTYVTLGAALASPAGVLAAAMQIPAHAAAKITLFFAAGAAYVALGVKQISQLDGVGRKIPITMLAYTVGALSIIGLPPLVGVWPKLWLFMGSWQAQEGEFLRWLPILALAISSLLSVVYLLEIPYRAFFRKADIPSGEQQKNIDSAPLSCWLAPLFTCLLSLILFVAAPFIFDMLQLLVQQETYR